MAAAETTLITPRRNFLIRALGFTAAGATMSIPIVALDSARSRIDHHAKELEKAWRDYYSTYGDVRVCNQFEPVAPSFDWRGERHYPTSIFTICAGGKITA